MERVKAFKKDPEEALYSEIERILDDKHKEIFKQIRELVKNPEDFEKLDKLVQNLPEDSEERILFERAKKFKEDPIEGAISEAEAFMNEDQKVKL